MKKWIYIECYNNFDMRKLIFLAIILRLLVSAFFFHPDIKTYNFQSSFLKKGVFNIYTYLVQNKKTLPLKEDFVYFPLTYFFIGSFQTLASPILGSNFDTWLADADSNSIVKNPFIFKYLVVLKLPYLILDIAIAYLLMEFFRDSKNKRKIWTIWLFNPFTIILIYVFGNVDIITAFLTLLSLLLAKKGKLSYAAAILGIAAGFKLYPLLLLPFLILKGNDLKEKLGLLGIPSAIFGLTTLPFLSKEFIDSAVISGLSTRLFYPGLPIGFNETIMVALSGAVAIFFWAYMSSQKINLLKYWTSLFLIIFSFAHFHIAWLVWIAPFLAILIVQKPKLKWPILFMTLMAFIIPFLYEDRSMNISLFRVYSTLYDILPTPFSLVEQFYDPYSLQSIFHSALVGAGLVTIYKLFSGEARPGSAWRKKEV